MNIKVENVQEINITIKQSEPKTIKIFLDYKRTINDYTVQLLMFLPQSKNSFIVLGLG